MRQFFYRSGFVIAIEIMVSVLFILCANAMINEKKDISADSRIR